MSLCLYEKCHSNISGEYALGLVLEPRRLFERRVGVVESDEIRQASHAGRVRLERGVPSIELDLNAGLMRS